MVFSVCGIDICARHTDDCLGMNEMRPIRMIEVCYTLSGKFKMLLLVMANWDVSSSAAETGQQSTSSVACTFVATPAYL